VEALLSPTHLVLALGLGLVVSGPVRAAWRRPRPVSEWAAQGPMILALTMLRSEKGSTTTYCPWAESLPVPAVEATIQFASGEKGRLLLWRHGRSVCQDSGLKWWFAYGW